MSHAFPYLYLLSGPKSAAQCNFLRKVFTSVPQIYICITVAVYVHVPCHATALCRQAASQRGEREEEMLQSLQKDLRGVASAC